MMDSLRHQELADFLKSRRLRLTPHDVNLPPQSARRRTKGLRREEVAALSGVSLAWYTYLEQGRPIRVSEQVLDSLARALRLTSEERDYLFTLASPLLTETPAQEEDEIPASLQAMMDRMADCPAYIIGARWDILAWNRLAREVYGDFSTMDPQRRNLVWRTFMDPDYRRLFADWEMIGKRLIAQVRLLYAKHLADPWYHEMVTNLQRQSPEFREWWQRHEVFGIPAGKKDILHPRAGRLCFDYHGFALSERPDWTLTVFVPDPATDTGDKLRTLL